MDQITEAERIVRLMLFIREHGPVDFTAIREALPYEYGAQAGTLDATRRRFERDKRTLQDFGVFFTIDEQQRYAIDSTLTVAAPLSLTKPQISLLRLLCGALLADKDYPLKDELRMVLVKLGDELEIPDMLPQLENGGLAIEDSKEPQGFAKIKRAISDRKLLTFSYASSGGHESMRTVEPFGCFFLKGICYVVAFDRDKEDERVFRLDRMSKIKLPKTSTKTSDFEVREFVASSYYGLPFQYGPEELEALLLFEDARSADVSALMMQQGSVELAEDGVLWRGACRDSKALASWCIQNGPGIRILKPNSARELYINGLRAFLSRSEEGSR